MVKIIMKQKELEQAVIFESLVRKEITQKAAAEALRLSVRQVQMKVKRFKSEGISGLAHKSRGRRSKRVWNVDQKEKAMTLVKTQFVDFGPTFATEKLDTLHNIKISRETLRKSMIKEGLWTTQRKMKIKRKRRERKANFGSMIQLMDVVISGLDLTFLITLFWCLLMMQQVKYFSSLLPLNR